MGLESYKIIGEKLAEDGLSIRYSKYGAPYLNPHKSGLVWIDKSTGTVYISRYNPVNSSLEWVTQTESLNVGEIRYLDYNNRNNIRSIESEDKYYYIDTLGIFKWFNGADYPDDDELCFSTNNGCWLLIAPTLDISLKYSHSEFDYLIPIINNHEIEIQTLIQNSDKRIFFLSYNDRNNIRSIESEEKYYYIDTLGIFKWFNGADYPDDDELCFRTVQGCWLLITPTLDISLKYSHSEFDYIVDDVNTTTTTISNIQQDISNLQTDVSNLQTDFSLSCFENIIINGDFQIRQRGDFKHLLVYPVSKPLWTTQTNYNVNDICIPVTENGFFYKCITAGISGASEPSWPTQIGDTVTDGTVEWICEGIATQERIVVDRFVHQYCDHNVLFTFEEDSINSTPTNCIKLIKIPNDPSSNASVQIRQKIETRDAIKLRGKIVTLSFWIKKVGTTFGSHKFQYEIVEQSGIDDTSWVGSVGNDTVFQNNDWIKVEYTKTLGTTFNTLDISIYSVGMNNGEGIMLANIQLEIGNKATEFKYRPYHVELSLCQRYFKRIVLNNGQRLWGISDVGSSANALITLNIGEMRTVPTFSYGGEWTITHDGTFTPVSSLTLSDASTNMVTLNVQSSGLPVNGSCLLRSNKDGSYLDFNAEII